MHTDATLTLLIDEGALDGELLGSVHLLAVDVGERGKAIFHRHLS